MGLLAWAMMGIAIWHFAIFIPDRFWGGIVGSFLFALDRRGHRRLRRIRASTSPARTTIELATALEAIPGALLGLGLAYGSASSQGNEPLEL